MFFVIFFFFLDWVVFVVVMVVVPSFMSVWNNGSQWSSRDRQRPLLQSFHGVVVRPRGSRAEVLAFGAVAAAEFLHLVTALEGSFGGGIIEEAAASGDGYGDLLPLVGFELAALERVPFFLVGLD